jgi:hypothetical protein
MKSIRRIVCAGVLALTALSLVPALASAQSSAYGQFTLPHDVHWQNAIVPAGEYKFSVEGDGALGVLTLSKMNGPRAGFMFLVSSTDETKPVGTSLLVLESTTAGSYVSAMQLPQFGVTLHFAVPGVEEKQIAKAETTALASASR